MTPENLQEALLDDEFREGLDDYWNQVNAEEKRQYGMPRTGTPATEITVDYDDE